MLTSNEPVQQLIMASILKKLNVVESATSLSSSEQSSNGEHFGVVTEKCCISDKPNKIVESNPTCSENAKSCENASDNSNRNNSYAGNKNMAEGLMDIALLSANANQLRFLITYNHEASTYYISITLVAVSLIMQITVGIALIFKRRFRRCRSKRYNEFILGGVFLITVVNILLAAFTTTTETK